MNARMRMRESGPDKGTFRSEEKPDEFDDGDDNRASQILAGAMMAKYQMVAIKRWWVPEWVFSVIVHWYRFLDSDVAEHPWMRALLLTEEFHYHETGRARYGRRCRECAR